MSQLSKLAIKRLAMETLEPRWPLTGGSSGGDAPRTDGDATGHLVHVGEGEGEDDPQQFVVVGPRPWSGRGNEPLTMDIQYSTTDSAINLNGFGLRVHYDSSLLIVENTDRVFQNAIVGAPSDREDLSNLDHDASTDHVLAAAWFDTSGNWPGRDLPIQLWSISFRIRPNTVFDATEVRFTASSTHPGYAFQSISFTITSVADWQNSPNRHDVNDDGSVTPIDALLVINELNRPSITDESGRIIVSREPGHAYFDVNGDRILTPFDAIDVINTLNAGKSRVNMAAVAAAIHADFYLDDTELDGNELDGNERQRR